LARRFFSIKKGYVALLEGFTAFQAVFFSGKDNAGSRFHSSSPVFANNGL
jgi:hypothetical protein